MGTIDIKNRWISKMIIQGKKTVQIGGTAAPVAENKNRWFYFRMFNLLAKFPAFLSFKTVIPKNT